VAALSELGVMPLGIETRTPTLDDVYLHFTGAATAEAA
jgi:hypothetical protein